MPTDPNRSEPGAEDVLSFLEAKADEWALEVDLQASIAALASAAGPASSRVASIVDALVHQAFIEGAYRGYVAAVSRAEKAEAERERGIAAALGLQQGIAAILKQIEAERDAARAALAEAEARMSVARSYFMAYCQDEADSSEYCLSEEQHERAKRFKEAALPPSPTQDRATVEREGEQHG